MYNNRIISENLESALVSIGRAIITLIPIILWLTKGGSIFNTSEDTSRKPFKTLEEYNNHKVFSTRTKMIISFVTFSLFVFIAIKTYFFYVPTNNEVSFALLIKYLNEKNILDNKFYSILRSYKPANIDKILNR
jgi:hypothetical protein